MKKYFKEEEMKRISLKDYFEKFESEYDSSYRTSDLKLKYARVKHIYTSLGDVQISEDMIDTLCETFDSTECRYGTVCLMSETVKDMYAISELFPELSKEGLLCISREYIKDLFEKYSLIEILAVMLRKDGEEDKTFEKFMYKVHECADKEDKIYDKTASDIRIFCGEYTYDFVRHFEKFVKQHHISRDRFFESLPSPELILKDQLELKEVSKRARGCFAGCRPITFQMFETYLDGDEELSTYVEQPSYYISAFGDKMSTSFTKQDFLDSIKERQKVRKR